MRCLTGFHRLPLRRVLHPFYAKDRGEHTKAGPKTGPAFATCSRAKSDQVFDVLAIDIGFDLGVVVFLMLGLDHAGDEQSPAGLALGSQFADASHTPVGPGAFQRWKLGGKTT